MKRLISLLLAFVIVLGCLSAGLVAVSATEDDTADQTETGDGEMHTSQACIDMLKEYEGFCKYPYWDYGQYTVGYGTRCPDDMLSYYRENGITEEEAQTLLENFLLDFEQDVLKYAEKYGLTFTQNQFDALILFSYNCGSAWTLNTSSEFHKAIASGADADELIYRFSLWSNAGGSILVGLVRRRLCEANLYINGVYSTSVPEDYGYVFYDGNGGDVSSRIQGYRVGANAEFASVATYEGYTFTGWYTAESGGTKVKTLDDSVKGKTLYAHWKASDGTQLPADETSKGVTVTVTTDDVNYRKGAGTSYEIIGQKNKGDQLLITETASGDGYTWGKFDGGWIALCYTNYDQVKDNPTTSNPDTTVNVNKTGIIKVSTRLIVREGPGTSYARTGYLEDGTRVTVTQEKTVDGDVWCKTEKGWFRSNYFLQDFDESLAKSVNKFGTIKVSTRLIVREGPGTDYARAGYLENGEKVIITKEYTADGTVWYKTDSGWFRSKYLKVSFDESKATAVSKLGTIKVSTRLRVRSGPDSSYALAGYYENGDRVTVTKEITVNGVKWCKTDKGWIKMKYLVLDFDESKATTVAKDGTVTGTTRLSVRKGPGTSYERVKYLEKGEQVIITKEYTVKGTVWGKTESGWISMKYVAVRFDESNATTVNRTGTIKVSTRLRVRTGPDSSYTLAGYYENGDKVAVNKTITLDGVKWGKTAKGWIKMKFVDLDKVQTNTVKLTGKVNVDYQLNVRSGAGTSYSIVGYLEDGDPVTVTQTKTVDGQTWGKISTGWINMSYVVLDEEAEEPVVKTVTADCLNVRSGAGTSYAIVDYVYEGAQVTILETKTVDGTLWGKISTGWISMDYVK